MTNIPNSDNLLDVRDGLTSKERMVLVCLAQMQREMGDSYVSTSMLYGRVVEHVDMSVADMQSILQRFGKG